MFLLIYYNQVLGAPAYLASTAIMLALVVDAITDPVIPLIDRSAAPVRQPPNAKKI
jgi:Na+/melibiose symporter-like transporter